MYKYKYNMSENAHIKIQELENTKHFFHSVFKVKVTEHASEKNNNAQKLKCRVREQ